VSNKKEKVLNPIQSLKKANPNINIESPDIYIDSLEKMLMLYYNAYEGKLALVNRILASHNQEETV
tara:strand:+ start:38 stop:235 length:198 start_codon:yes stop_codon:yes gene_type:complete